jgi:hypothetical protein
VEGILTASWKYNRPRGVVLGFQVSKHRVECHVDDASNVFSKHPTGLCFDNNSKHFLPEVTVILLASLLPGSTEGLARESACEEVNPSEGGCVKVTDVPKEGYTWELL